jgi:NhaP-type Na+/H+ or K+/H+ antiporter
VNQIALLIFGAAVLTIVVVGIFAYGMMSFSRWSDADSKI